MAAHWREGSVAKARAEGEEGHFRRKLHDVGQGQVRQVGVARVADARLAKVARHAAHKGRDVGVRDQHALGHSRRAGCVHDDRYLLRVVLGWCGHVGRRPEPLESW